MSGEQGDYDGASNLLGLFAPPVNNDDTSQNPFPNSKTDEEDLPQVEQERPRGQLHSLGSYDDIDAAHADMDAPAGSVSYMMGLFAMPNGSALDGEVQKETTPLLAGNFSSWKESMDKTPKSSVRSRKHNLGIETSPSLNQLRVPSLALPVIEEVPPTEKYQSPAKLTTFLKSLAGRLKICVEEAVKPTTFIGAFMFLLFHVVFSLALGSAINRPHSSTSLLGLMTQTAALGTISSSAVYWWFLSSDFPALYPTADLFLAPFLANLAVNVDETLSQDQNVSADDNDTVFLATFGLLTAIGICFSGALLALSGIFKLANLGSFLPFPVICGFFSAVGILMWMLAITVDTGGKSIWFVLKSGDAHLIRFTILHHIPTIFVASIMKYLGPKHPFFIIMSVFGTIGIFYGVMFLAGVSLEEAKEMGWFWSRDELVYGDSSGLTPGLPPAPFGMLYQLFRGKVHWGAVANGMPTSIALGFLYVVRCSVHAAALKKNLLNLSRKVPSPEVSQEATQPSPTIRRPGPLRTRQFSEAVDIEAVMVTAPPTAPAPIIANKAVQEIRAQPSNLPLKAILAPYGISQFVSALFGGFAITPAIGASSTLYSLGADGLAPQITSVVLLFSFYITDFQLVGYIPKPAFSSMLVLSFMDLIYPWFYQSYFKTKDKSEWMVVPTIVLCAFIFDLLTAVFLGIAFSTFIFVGSFFRSGVVKYVANGTVIHSTVERPFGKSDWLMENGDYIQILVLQNYLFFGNASAVYGYIASMFQRTESNDAIIFETRKPKFLILDLTLITGMDTSTVDIFNDIRNLCASNNCKLFVTGLTSSLRGILNLGGFKPETTDRSKRKLRFFSNLDAALGKAEDLLLDAECDEYEVTTDDARMTLSTEVETQGFRKALRHIDDEHEQNFSSDLLDWQVHTQLVELQPGDQLYKSRESDDMERGLFFIESGVLKIEQDTSATLTHRGTARSSSRRDSSGPSISAIDSLTKIQAMEYSNILDATRKGEARTFRLARYGPGWIAGTLEALSGQRRPGFHIAVTHCRLHHLPFSKIAEVEKSNPALVLNLYKLLAFMMARRQEATIGQLATLHAIMTSPASSQGLTKLPAHCKNKC